MSIPRWLGVDLGEDGQPNFSVILQISLKSGMYVVFRNAVRAKLISSGVLDDSTYVVIAGPSNVYSHYVTTSEEYRVQRYEGASTLYGPRMLVQLRIVLNCDFDTFHLFFTDTLDAYIDIYTNLVKYLIPGSAAYLAPGPTPPNQISVSMSLQVENRRRLLSSLGC